MLHSYRSRRAGANPHDVRRAPAGPPRGRGRVLAAAAGSVARGRHRRGLRQRAPGRLHPERAPAPAGDAQRQLPCELSRGGPVSVDTTLLTLSA